MKNRFGFAEECPLPRDEKLALHVKRSHPWVMECQWLLASLLETGCLPDTDHANDVADAIFRAVETKWPSLSGSDQVAVALLLEVEVRREPHLFYRPDGESAKWAAPESAIDLFREHCVDNRVDFKAAMTGLIACERSKHLRGEAYSYHVVTCVKWLHDKGLLHPDRCVDPARFGRFYRKLGWMGEGIDSSEYHGEYTDLDSPIIWMDIAHQSLLGYVTAEVHTLDDHEANQLIASCLRLSRLVCHFSGTDHSLTRHVDVERWAFELINSRLPSDVRRGHEGLRQMWLRLFMELPGRSLESLASTLRERLYSAAGFELGSIRKALREGGLGTDRKSFEEQRPILYASAAIVFELGGVWQGMKHMLLLLRELKHKSVGKDMRYRFGPTENSDDSVEPWNEIPSTLIQSFHSFVRREQDKDPDLEGLRSEFAAFCIERLKSDPKTGEPREQSAVWRYGYAQALRALFQNPGGSGHRVLYHAMQKDPDTDVRVVAAAAYNDLRHNKSLPAGTGPRKAIIYAIVCLFQTHYLSLSPEGTALDSKKTQSTRDALVRRTAEPKREP